MSMKQKIVTIFGGTGFLGKQIVRECAERGYIVKVATRIPESAYFLKPYGNVGQIVPVACNYNDTQSIASAVDGADYVVNCIGILFEKGRSTFKKAHVDIPTEIAKSCAKQGVKKFVHISALSCDASSSYYAQTKLEGEDAIKKEYPAASILRPSVIFGEDDNFFNMFASLLPFVPFLPLIGGGNAKFQPAYVGDIADAAMACIDQSNTAGQTYELGGPEVMNFKEIYQYILKHTGYKKTLIRLPYSIAKLEAFFMEFLPKPLLTRDQVESLKTDNVVSNNTKGFDDLNIQPTSMDLIVPGYLKRYRRGGRFSDISKTT